MTANTTISNYVKNNSQTQRQSHIDLATPCIPSEMTKDWRGKKAGDYTTTRIGMSNAKESLKDYLQLSGSTSRRIHLCHLCDNTSSAPNDFVCINPQHLYFGTVTENHHDKPEDLRKEIASSAGKIGGKIGGKKSCAKNAKKAMENGNHISQQTYTCPHCNKTGKGGIMLRWHFDNCKHK